MSAAPPPTDVSIIVVSWNVRDLLRECLASVRQQALRPPEAQDVHVVDNASADGSADMVRREFPEVAVTANEANLGFARANNQALAACRGRYVMLLNPDTVVLDHAVDRMIDWMDAHPDAGVLGCRLLNSDRSFQRAAGGAFPCALNVAWNYLFLNKVLPRRWAPAPLFLEEDHHADRDVDWVCGAALMVRAELVRDRILDESFFMFGEDMELCERVARQGWRVVHSPAATILHHHGRSMARQDSSMVLTAALKGPRAFYVRRNGGGGVRLYDLIVLLGYLIRWPLFGLLSLRGGQERFRELSRDSRRHAGTALKLLLFGDPPP